MTLALGLLALGATVFTCALSLSEDFNPPHWVRIAGLMWLPIGFFGTPVADAIARHGPGRQRARVGLVAAGAGLVVFVVLLYVAG